MTVDQKTFQLAKLRPLLAHPAHERSGRKPPESRSAKQLTAGAAAHWRIARATLRRPNAQV